MHFVQSPNRKSYFLIKQIRVLRLKVRPKGAKFIGSPAAMMVKRHNYYDFKEL